MQNIEKINIVTQKYIYFSRHFKDENETNKIKAIFLQIFGSIWLKPSRFV